jgi:multidrug efflux pump
VDYSSNFSSPFIRRPVATTLLSIAIFMSGAIAFNFLPVAPLPQVDFPTISIGAALPGASPETMASSVATPLERQFGRIASVTQMTSTSQLGQTGITLQFDLNRDINAAARDVEAAINAARGQLPAGLPNQPTYRKVNPADAPIMLLALQSDNYLLPEMYDVANSVLAQKLSQIQGVGQVFVGGSSSPAVRVQVNPQQLNSYGVSLEAIRAVLSNANANRPKGATSDGKDTYVVNTTDQLFKAKEYKNLVVTWHQGAAIRLADVGNVVDSVTDVRNSGVTNGKPGVILVIFRQPGANMIDTVDRVRTLMPILQASISPSMHLSVIIDRTTTIRSSIRDVEITLGISVILVILVVFVFLRSFWATVIPSVSVPLSLVATFGVMYLCGYSLDNLSLMALTISTGFVVDDAIVVLENITRHIEAGMKPYEAALLGASEIGFTVLSMSISLIAVFIPILMMGGIVGRLFREFAVTLSVAIVISLAVSLSTTPMMCARFLRHSKPQPGRVNRFAENAFNGLVRGYDVGLTWVLRHPVFTMLVLFLTVALNVYLFAIVPKGFFPQQDTGRLNGMVLGDQDISFASITSKMAAFSAIVLEDPAVDTVSAFTGGGNGTNTARLFMQLKAKSVRKVSSEQVLSRLRGKLAKIPGAALYLQSVQDVSVGGRLSNAQYQFTLQADQIGDLTHWAPLLMERLRKIPQLRDVNSDQQLKGLEATVVVDRDTAYRMGISIQAIDDTLNDAFGQRQVSVMYEGINQYYVVMEVLPEFQQNPDYLNQVYVAGNTGKLVPLSAFSHFAPSNTALTINHQGIFPAITLSFNLAQGTALGDAVTAIESAQRDLAMPATVHATFQGTAQAFQDSLSSEPILILAALVAVYIVLGILYESYIHPITILSTLPSAGVGALLALRLFKMDLSIIALIGIVLLIGIVKKNAILMIDFALQAERQENLSPVEAIHRGALLRFRPIMMTTMAAMLGAVPLAIGNGDGAELRRPLGVAIVGGLILSQLLTIFTTPVVYVYLDRFQSWIQRSRHRVPVPAPAPAHSD